MSTWSLTSYPSPEGEATYLSPLTWWLPIPKKTAGKESPSQGLIDANKFGELLSPVSGEVGFNLKFYGLFSLQRARDTFK